MSSTHKLVAVLIAAVLIFAYFLIFKSKNNVIILFNGTSASGKTSIVNEMQKKYGHLFKVASIDSKFGGPNVYKHAKELYLKGDNVIIDTVRFDTDYEKACSVLDCKNIKKILIYTPFDILLKRIEYINISDPKHHRGFVTAIREFMDIYKIKNSENDTVIDIINSKDMKRSLENIKSLAIEQLKLDLNSPAAHVKFSKKDISEYLDQANKLFVDFVNYFKLNSTEIIELSTNRKWDQIINTSINSSSEIAEFLEHLLFYDVHQMRLKR